jgi:hypothetical protein
MVNDFDPRSDAPKPRALRRVRERTCAMHGTFTTRSEDVAIDLSRIDCEIVVIADPEPDLVAQYRVTCSDRETGTIIGSYVVPARAGGAPPAITVGDIAESIGRYRIASIYVEIEAMRLAGINRRCTDRARRHARGWLRRVPGSDLAEHGIFPGGRS